MYHTPLKPNHTHIHSLHRTHYFPNLTKSPLLPIMLLLQSIQCLYQNIQILGLSCIYYCRITHQFLMLFHIPRTFLYQLFLQSPPPLNTGSISEVEHKVKWYTQLGNTQKPIHCPQPCRTDYHFRLIAR